MFKIPFISDTPSTVKTRSGFPDPPESTRVTPSVARSISRDNLLQSSAVRNFNEREEFRDASSNNTLAVRSFDLPEDPSFWKDHNVQVIIRLRPLNSSEISLHGHNRCVRQESCQTVTWTGHPDSRFTFDLVADENVSQEKLFKVAGVPMVENCVGGYNSCMFAYGQTGSGKTHTMLGDIEGGTRRHSVNCGMTPRVFEYLFSRIQKEKEVRREEKLRFTCKCSFLEIYNEQILDLLNPSSVNLQIREDLKKGVYVENLTEIEVTSARDVMQQLLEGAANRKVAATNMNRASSRSHSVFTCVIESTWESQGVTHHRFARLHLVDLAGSERQKSSGAEGERLKEATNINKSLSTLGLVIMNLVSISNGKSLHVPYRDSKLTFLLQDSLGGNSKTIIIANISPSTCSSLETLSTLKFAQRAKFIKNNAIVNEDASGDVIAMRMQIQQLKKEVSHLRGVLNGGAGNQDNDNVSLGLLASPATFKWDGFSGMLSGVTPDKRMSQKKEYEVALVGAFKREKDKDMALQALVAENQATMQLAKQREDEIQGLKMRLRFREAGIKRLESVASGKISAEAHLLKEKEEHLKEIEVLRAQVDRNQEVTRFAMENLRLKEEIRRLKILCEEGEMERMNEQIITLQNKLLEALDWKLMHESNPSYAQKTPVLLTGSCSDLDQLNPEKESLLPSSTLIKEENEFLRVQAIQNQAEIDSLQKKLNSCMDAKATLDRHVKDLETELESVKALHAQEVKQKSQNNQPSIATTDVSKVSLENQQELKAMVAAIASASQREAEAHKENDELRAKIKVLVEDNNKLIELYERAVAEINNNVTDFNAPDPTNEAQFTQFDATSDEKGSDIKKLEDLEHQLVEMHEENEKLMSLYEKAMQERDDFKKRFSSAVHNKVADKVELECPEKLVVVDEGDYSLSCGFIDDRSPACCKEMDKPVLSAEGEASEENISSNWNSQLISGQCSFTPPAGADAAVEMDVESNEQQNSVDPSLTLNISIEASSQHLDEILVFESVGCVTRSSVDCKNSVQLDELDAALQLPGCFKIDADKPVNVATYKGTIMEDKLALVRIMLEKVRENLSNSSETVSEFQVLEKAIHEVDELSREIEAKKDLMQFKQQEIGSLKLHYSEIQETRALLVHKLAALKLSLSNFISSIDYFKQREERAKARVEVSTSSLELRMVTLAACQIRSDIINSKRREIQEAETELRDKHSYFKSKLEEEKRRQENERVLFAIDNVEKTQNPSTQNGRKLGKATELLKSEEEKIKLQNEIKQSRENLIVLKKGREELNRKCQMVDNEKQVASLEMEKTSKFAEETKLGFQNVVHEKNVLLEMMESGKADIDNLIAEYQVCVFEECVREDELKIVGEDMRTMSKKIEELMAERAVSLKKATELSDGSRSRTGRPSEKLQQELGEVFNSILEFESLLFSENLTNSQAILSCRPTY